MALGINGMGRIGRLALRDALGGVIRDASDTRGPNGIEVAHLNEVKGGAETTAHLLEFDSVHGRWRANFDAAEDAITVDNHRMGFTGEAGPGGPRLYRREFAAPGMHPGRAGRYALVGGRPGRSGADSA